jgi:hypothetical protein
MTNPIFKRILIIGSIATHRKTIAAAVNRYTKNAKLAGCDVSKQAYPGPGFSWPVYDLLIIDASEIAPATKAWLGKIKKLINLPPTIIINWGASIDDAGDFYRLGVVDYLAFSTPSVQRMQRALIHATQSIDNKGNKPGTPAAEIVPTAVVNQSAPPTQEAKKATPPETPAPSKAPQESAISQSPAADSKRSVPDDVLTRANNLIAAAGKGNETKSDAKTPADKLAEIPDIPDTQDALDDEYEDEESGAFEDLSSVSQSLADDEEESASLADPSFVTSGLLSILGEDKKENKEKKPVMENDHSGYAEASFVTSGLMSILDNQGHPADGDQKVSSGSGFGYGWPFTPEEIEKGEAWLGDFQVFEFVSMGRSSSVFKAKQKDNTDTLAVKLFNPDTADEACKSRFHRGFQLLAKVKHPNIAKIYAPGEYKDWLYVVMEYFPKSDLKSRLRQPIKPEHAIEYALQIAAGLQAAHQQQIIHRALKPSDILFRKDGSLALADFGIAKTMIAGDNELTKEGLSIGKPDYISPEQAQNQPLDARSDLYSLGIIMYEMLEGRRPFIGASATDTMRAHISTPMPPMAKGQGCVGNVVRKLLEKAPEDRYPDSASVIEALKNCQ